MSLVSKKMRFIVSFSLLISTAIHLLSMEENRSPKNPLIELPIKKNKKYPQFTCFYRDKDYAKALEHFGLTHTNDRLKARNPQGIGIAGMTHKNFNLLIQDCCGKNNIKKPESHETIYNMILHYNHLLDNFVIYDAQINCYKIDYHFCMSHKKIDLSIDDELNDKDILDAYLDACFVIKNALVKGYITPDNATVRIDKDALGLKKIKNSLVLMRIVHNVVKSYYYECNNCGKGFNDWRAHSC